MWDAYRSYDGLASGGYNFKFGDGNEWVGILDNKYSLPSTKIMNFLSSHKIKRENVALKARLELNLSLNNKLKLKRSLINDVSLLLNSKNQSNLLIPTDKTKLQNQIPVIKAPSWNSKTNQSASAPTAFEIFNFEYTQVQLRSAKPIP